VHFSHRYERHLKKNLEGAAVAAPKKVKVDVKAEDDGDVESET
jgi:hypothetical protein